MAWPTCVSFAGQSRYASLEPAAGQIVPVPPQITGRPACCIGPGERCGEQVVDAGFVIFKMVTQCLRLAAKVTGKFMTVGLYLPITHGLRPVVKVRMDKRFAVGLSYMVGNPSLTAHPGAPREN